MSRPAAACALLAVAIAVTLSCGGDTMTNPRLPEVLTRAHVVEALFLGGGPALARAISSACVLQHEGVWWGYDRDDPVRIVLASSVGERDRPAIQAMIDQLTEATGGRLAVSVVESNRESPRPGPNEITLVEVDPETQAQRCGFQGTGCFKCTSSKRPRLDSCRIYIRNNLEFSPGTVHNHEIGHALGFCHISGGALRPALMGSPQQGSSNLWTPEELDAIAAVYASDLELGATRSDFVAAGLVD